MQLSGALCFAILTITVTATCAQTESRKYELAGRRYDRRINRRGATVIFDNFPVDAFMTSNMQNPKVIYQRLTRHKYGPPVPKYGPPGPKYGPPKASRRPGKKNRGKHSSLKHGHPRPEKLSPKLKHRPSQRPKSRPMYGPPKMIPQYASYFVPQPFGYGEPPSEYVPDYQPQKQNYAEPPEENYAEPPVDSYGAPLKVMHDSYPAAQTYHETRNNPLKVMHDSYPAGQTYHETRNNIENQKYNYQSDAEQDDWNMQKYNTGNNYQQNDWKSLQSEQNDNYYAPSKKKPKFTKPSPTIFVTPIPDDDDDDNFDSYSDNYSHRQTDNDEDSSFNIGNKKPHFINRVKPVNRPWKPQKVNSEYDGEIIVGGQYAEPPARKSPKFTPSAPMYNEDDEEFASVKRLGDSGVLSATTSPYLNYKNSNMAFSPQNLNDAFSIVDN